MQVIDKPVSVLNGPGTDAQVGRHIVMTFLLEGRSKGRCVNTSKAGKVYSHDLFLMQVGGTINNPIAADAPSMSPDEP